MKKREGSKVEGVGMLALYFPNEKLNAPSEITSLNQNDMEATSEINPNVKRYPALEKPCINKTPAVVNVNRATQVNKGQGEGETKWNGCAWKLALVKFVIFFFFYCFTLEFYYFFALGIFFIYII